MPLHDLDRGAILIDAGDIFRKYVRPIERRLDKDTFDDMVKLVDSALKTLKPSQASQLVWTKCAALCGYQADLKGADNKIWQPAMDATTFDPDGANKFVGSLIMWRISLLKDTWLSTKTQDEGGIHPYRTYWINNKFVPFKQFTAQDLLAKFNRL